MKNMLLISALFWGQAGTPGNRPAYTPVADYGELHVRITHVRNHDGYMRLAVYDDASHFLDEAYTPFVERAVTITGDEVDIRITGLPRKDYAIAILHDENRDKKMNFNFIGLPKEGWGFSNNARPLLSKPGFGECRVSLKENAVQTLTIDMVYW